MIRIISYSISSSSVSKCFSSLLLKTTFTLFSNFPLFSFLHYAIFLLLICSPIAVESPQNLKWKPSRTYWEPTRNPEKHMGNHRGNKQGSWGNHRGIIWKIGETPPTWSPTPTASHIRRCLKVDSYGFSVGSPEFAA